MTNAIEEAVRPPSLLLLLVSSIDTKSASFSLGTTFPAATLLLRVDEAVADLLLEELLHVGLPLLQLLRRALRRSRARTATHREQQQLWGEEEASCHR